MPAAPEDIVHAVAVLIARHRQGQAFASYTFADAVDDNSAGWGLEYVDGVRRLDSGEIEEAWSRSNQILHAWA